MEFVFNDFSVTDHSNCSNKKEIKKPFSLLVWTKIQTVYGHVECQRRFLTLLLFSFGQLTAKGPRSVHNVVSKISNWLKIAKKYYIASKKAQIPIFQNKKDNSKWKYSFLFLEMIIVKIVCLISVLCSGCLPVIQTSCRLSILDSCFHFSQWSSVD